MRSGGTKQNKEQSRRCSRLPDPKGVGTKLKDTPRQRGVFFGIIYACQPKTKSGWEYFAEETRKIITRRLEKAGKLFHTCMIICCTNTGRLIFWWTRKASGTRKECRLCRWNYCTRLTWSGISRIRGFPIFWKAFPFQSLEFRPLPHFSARAEKCSGKI